MSRPERGTRGTRSKRPGWDASPGRKDENAGAMPRGEHDDLGLGDGPSGFLCSHCGLLVPENAPGTGQRNHCPHCLWSLHVDIKPGDRSSRCKGDMEPIALWASGGADGELRIIHRCSRCGVLKPNRVAGDDSEAELTRILGATTSAVRNAQS